MSSSASWTPDRVEALRRLWRDGLSAARIAALLGGVTRNAVLGKVHRLGLSGGARPAKPAPRRAPPEKRLRRPVAAAGPLVTPRRRADVARLERPGEASILSIGPGACRWPIGDPKRPGFSLCGAAAVRGAYCEAHAALAYRPLARKPPWDHLLKLAGLA